MRYLGASILTFVVLSVLSYGSYFVAAASSKDYDGGVGLVVWLLMCVGASVGVTVCIIGPLSGLIGYVNRVRGIGKRKLACWVIGLTYAVPIIVTLIAARGKISGQLFEMPLIVSTYFAAGYLCFWGVYFRKKAEAAVSSTP